MFMEKLQQKIDYKFKDIKLLERALQHTSYVNENKRNHSEIESNEKLEFLGDAVLSLVR